MTNRWTGDYDAVVEATANGVGRVLAALHRKGNPSADAGDGPRLLHNLWINLPLAGVDDGSGVAGLLRLQTAPAKVAFPGGAGADRIRVSIELFWHLFAVPGGAAAPEFAHGTVEVTAGVDLTSGASDLLAVAAVDPASLDLRFVAASGATLPASELDLVERTLRTIALEVVEPVSLRYDLTPELRGIDFKTLPSAAGAPDAAAALLTLSDHVPPAPDPGLVSETFVRDGEDFGVALGGDFAVRGILDMARTSLADIPVRVSGSFFIIPYSVVATARVSTLRVELLPGVIRATISGDGRGRIAFFGSNFTFTLTQDFRLVASGGSLRVEPAALPDVSASGLAGTLVSLFRGRVQEALAASTAVIARQATDQLGTFLDQSIARLFAELEVLPAVLRFTRASIDPDGIVVQGFLDLVEFRPPIATFTKYLRPGPDAEPLSLLLELDAYESWIPGGAVRLYRWQLVRGDGTIAHQIDAPHSFVERVPPGLVFGPGCIWPPCQWCLEVSGVQTAPRPGPDRPVTSHACGIGFAPPTVDIPPVGGGIGVAVPDGSGGVVAHLDPWGSYLPGGSLAGAGGTSYALVHRAGSQAADAVDLLAEALLAVEEEGRRLFVLVLVDDDTELGGLQARWPRVAFALDPDRRWSRHFDVAEPDSTLLFGLQAERLWRHNGPLEKELVTKALGEFVTETAGEPRWKQVRLRIRDGERAPDFDFEHPSGHRIGIRKFQGREVVLCFWRSWSSPSIEELARLEKESANCQEPRLVLAVNDGEPRDLAAERFAKLGLESVLLATDPKRNVARRYGVTCWPTVVHVDGRGRVAGVRFGLATEPSADQLATTSQ